MNQLLKALATLIIAISVGTAFAQEPNRRDGNWWRTQSRVAQVNYMVGFFDGMELGHSFSHWKFFNDYAARDTINRVTESYNEYAKKYFQTVTSGQLVDGLDVFYADFRNRSILVQNAVWLVVNQIAGTPQERIDAMTEAWRRSPAR